MLKVLMFQSVWSDKTPVIESHFSDALIIIRFRRPQTNIEKGFIHINSTFHYINNSCAMYVHGVKRKLILIPCNETFPILALICRKKLQKPSPNLLIIHINLINKYKNTYYDVMKSYVDQQKYYSSVDVMDICVKLQFTKEKVDICSVVSWIATAGNVLVTKLENKTRIYTQIYI